jgi:fructan beta-fructosidase
MKIFSSLIFVFFLSTTCTNAQEIYKESYRPQIHFSPKEKWINDPNGMVYYEGTYHLFFQFYPDSIVWGPMHWGHATSKDLIHWQQQPIALYPDSLGYIYSGSAVVDKNNTSGFGKNGQIPLVAIFTSHDPVRVEAHRNDYENQSLAYSLDDGNTWTKYKGNPVLRNPGITDFRDPKVMWYEPAKKWIMTLATKNKVSFYSSPDLENWKKESDFGENAGAHGGVWECPDLFSLDDHGNEVWVLIVNINPGAPNLGSGTQYFVGSFDGKKFKSIHADTKWLDYGPDDYAGVTWSNTGNRKIFLGWMSNWIYANLVPTIKWRNAMTLPRELGIKHVDDDVFVVSRPVKELDKIEEKRKTVRDLMVTKSLEITKETGKLKFPCRLNLSLETIKDFSIKLSNNIGEELVIGFDKKQDQFYIDRTRSGKTSFQKDFAGKATAPRFINGQRLNLSLIFDESSVELYGDDGLTTMTSILFPNKPYNKLNISSPGNLLINKLEYVEFKSIWK